MGEPRATRTNLWLWVINPEERLVFHFGAAPFRFRFPWSSRASVRMMREIGWYP